MQEANLSTGDFYCAKIGSQRVTSDQAPGWGCAQLSYREVKANQEGVLPGRGAAGTKAWRYTASVMFQNNGLERGKKMA